ncbi:MAG: nucleotidyltransferase family protein [Actinomycetota bacterium]|nr:nucleotidyltransferase family protein [Actinomycetota bacterium]
MLLSALSMDGRIEQEVEAEARRLAEGIRAAGLPVRMLGGLAILLHATAGMHPALARGYADIDLVCSRKAGRDTARFLVSAGYEANERFNAMNGSERMIFYDRPHARHVDLFVGSFRMCHALPLADRLDRDAPTLPPAELLLTKLQVVQLNVKDANDMIALLLDHDVAEHDDEAVNAAYAAQLLAGDWGLWRTSRGSLERMREIVAQSALSAEEQARVQERAERLWERVESEPKGLRWRSRARIGEAKRWYDEPDEIAHQR